MSQLCNIGIVGFSVCRVRLFETTSNLPDSAIYGPIPSRLVDWRNLAPWSVDPSAALGKRTISPRFEALFKRLADKTAAISRRKNRIATGNGRYTLMPVLKGQVNSGRGFVRARIGG
jgi:hypothetical protein